MYSLHHTSQREATKINTNKIQLLIICLFATFIISGVVTTMGLIIPRAALQFNVDVVDMASQFTWFTGGVFLGYLLSFIIFDKFSIKQVLITAYLTAFAALVLIHFTSNFLVLGIWFASFGIAISIAVCGSGTMITRLWFGNARQSVLVAQDAMFNGGGLVFSACTTWFITHQMPFSSTYLVIAAIIIFVLILSAISKFSTSDANPNADADTVADHDIKTEWNAGIILIGISLMLFMMAKIAAFIWAPQFVEQEFKVGSDVSGQFMTNIFTAALLGSFAGTWLVTRINVKYLVYGFVIVAATSLGLFTVATEIESMMWLGYLFGISVSATFNAYMAFALTFVSVPTHRNIAYMLLMSGLGSSFAPIISSQSVKIGGNIESAIILCFVIFILVTISLFVSEVLSSKHKSRSVTPTPST